MNCDVQGKEFINNIVFLSPPDFANRIRCYNDYEDLLREAKENVESGNPNKLIKVHFFYKTSSSFLSMMSSKNFDNLPLVNGETKDFFQYTKIDKPISIIYGSEENYIKNYRDKLISFANPNTSVECLEIIGADHIYFGKEEIVGKQIASCLDKNYIQNSKIPFTLRKKLKNNKI